ncbi:methylenetetrahydrofolate reductase [NAD(P)H] [Malassezia sp. CBS 17886]|nr:methylenetetrahydrofolate reductase [NAD(P)H] [Malassezia sp. CBS 17886]
MPQQTASRIDDKLATAPAHECQWSIEFFPPKTADGLANLLPRMQRMVTQLDPSWIHVTWGAGGSTRASSMELAARVQNGLFDPNDDWAEHEAHAGTHGVGGRDVCLHLTCTNVERDALDAALDEARRFGIRNILALRGDAPRGAEYWVATDQRFQHATDLVRYIREKHGEDFCIGVAGYPEGLVEAAAADARDLEQELAYLREKQAAGAQFIVTQLFYDVDAFITWEQACRRHGITVPIIPGIMPVQNYHSFRRMTNLCRVRAPARIVADLEAVKTDDAQVKEIGVQLAVAMIEQIRAQTKAHAFHLYSLNLEKSVSRVIRAVASDAPAAGAALLDPETWDEFPNGRYGDARSPAFGEIDGYGASLKLPPAEAIRLWGTPVDDGDLSRMFAAYVSGRLECIPWCDIPVWDETMPLLPALLRLNQDVADGGRGWWTVGSQPAVDGMDSSDATFGFGPRGGYIFQKAFVELFVTEADKDRLVRAIDAAQVPVTYFAGYSDPDSFETNVLAYGLNAVTWGVFPGKEVAQSTIIEEQSFRAWRDEAFAIWREWELLFPPRSPTRELLRRVHDDRWLVTVVYHDYKDADGLWRLLDNVE